MYRRGGNKRFVLTRGTVHISPFSVSLSCLGDDETQDYTAILGLPLIALTTLLRRLGYAVP